MNVHSYFSDNSNKNDATKFEYMKKFINCMYEEDFSIKDGIIYDTSDV